MARKTLPLSDTEIRQAKPKDKEYTLTDGGGLLLRITASGSKTWFLNYTHPHTQKRNKISLGSYPAISLLQARKERERFASLLASGIDPKQHRENEKRTQKVRHVQTLEAVFRMWLEVWKQGKDSTTVKKAARQFELYVLPKLGAYPLIDISAPLVIDALRPLETAGKLETLGRVCTKLNQVMVLCNKNL